MALPLLAQSAEKVAPEKAVRELWLLFMSMFVILAVMLPWENSLAKARAASVEKGVLQMLLSLVEVVFLAPTDAASSLPASF